MGKIFKFVLYRNRFSPIQILLFRMLRNKPILMFQAWVTCDVANLRKAVSSKQNANQILRQLTLAMFTLWPIAFRAGTTNSPVQCENLSDTWLSTIAIGIRFLTEIAPNSLLLCVMRSPMRHDFRVSARDIHYSVKVALRTSGWLQVTFRLNWKKVIVCLCSWKEERDSCNTKSWVLLEY